MCREIPDIWQRLEIRVEICSLSVAGLAYPCYHQDCKDHPGQPWVEGGRGQEGEQALCEPDVMEAHSFQLLASVPHFCFLPRGWRLGYVSPPGPDQHLESHVGLGWVSSGVCELSRGM